MFAAAPSSNYDLWEVVYNAAELLSQLKESLRGFDHTSQSSVQQILELLDHAVVQEQNLDGWAQHVPPENSYELIPIHTGARPEWLRTLFEGEWRPRGIHLYPSLLAEMKWRFYWTVRLVLGEAVLHSINLVERAGQKLSRSEKLLNHRRQTKSTIVALIDRLCESCLSVFAISLPSKPTVETSEYFCSARGYVLLSPLLVIKLCLGREEMLGLHLPGQKQWVQNVMWLLEHEVGFAKAGAIIPAPQNDKIAVQLWGFSDEDDGDGDAD